MEEKVIIMELQFIGKVWRIYWKHQMIEKIVTIAVLRNHRKCMEFVVDEANVDHIVSIVELQHHWKYMELVIGRSKCGKIITIVALQNHWKSTRKLLE